MVALTLPADVVLDLDPDLYVGSVPGIFGTYDTVNPGGAATLDGRSYSWFVSNSNHVPNPGPQQDAGWSPAPATTRTNRATRTRPYGGSIDTTGWKGDAGDGTTPTGTLAVRAADASFPAAYRFTFTAASVTLAGIAADLGNVVDIVDNGEQWTFSMRVRTSSFQSLRLSVTWQLPGGRETTATVGAATNVSTLGSTLTVTDTVTAGATGVYVRAEKASGTWSTDQWIEVLEFLAEKTSAARPPFFDGADLGEWTGTPGASTSTFTPPADTVATLDTGFSRLPGRKSRKLVRGATDPTKLVCVMEGIGGTSGLTTLAPTPSSPPWAPRLALHVYTETPGLRATLQGHGNTVSADLTPGEWKRLDGLGAGSYTTIAATLVVSTVSGAPVTGGEAVWVCDALCAPQVVWDYFDGDLLTGQWAGTPGDSASHGVLAVQEVGGRKELVFGGNPQMSASGWTFAESASMTFAVACTPEGMLGATREMRTGNNAVSIIPGAQPAWPIGTYAPAMGRYASFTDAQVSGTQHTRLHGQPIAFVGTNTNTPSAQQRAWTDGTLTQETTKSFSPDANGQPTLVFNGSVRRLLVWNRILTDEEVAQVSTELARLNMISSTASWEAPPDGGSPITGYVVRHFDGTTITETELGPEVLTLDVEGTEAGHVIQVLAVNAVGRGQPVEIEIA